MRVAVFRQRAEPDDLETPVTRVDGVLLAVLHDAERVAYEVRYVKWEGVYYVALAKQRRPHPPDATGPLPCVERVEFFARRYDRQREEHTVFVESGLSPEIELRAIDAAIVEKNRR